jgi:hypothetical protein
MTDSFALPVLYSLAQVCSSEFFTVAFDLSNEGGEEILPASRGCTLRCGNTNFSLRHLLMSING